MSQHIGKTGAAYARLWHKVDLSDRVLGRVATKIAITLMGKHKPIYNQGIDCGDHVVVINAKDVAVTGKKAEQKKYYSHSGYAGGLNIVPYKRMLERTPEQIILKAVSKMLPKNRLRKIRLERLHIFRDDNHPHEVNFVKRYDQEIVGCLDQMSLDPVDHKKKTDSILSRERNAAARKTVLDAGNAANEEKEPQISTSTTTTPTTTAV